MPDSTTGNVPAGNITTSSTAAVPRETLGQHIGGFFHRGEADAAALITRVPGIEAAIRDHAGTVFSVAAEFLDLAKIADPAIAPALGPVSVALAALEVKILAMTQSAAVITGKLSGSKPAA